MGEDARMAVVRLRGPLKRLAGDCREHALTGATVQELLRALEAAHPATAGWILDERGSIRRHINVFVNGELGARDTAVGDDDRVDVLPAISGGR
jgi:molybdopterin converting factor small subunit